MEHRRRDEEDGTRSGEKGWKFWRWDEWLLASRDEWTEGCWNVVDRMIAGMRFVYIGPRTNEFGEAEVIEEAEGLKILRNTKQDGEREMEDQQMGRRRNGH